jgi:hypothetical protein
MARESKNREKGFEYEPPKIWKENGEEQKELEKLFSDGIISDKDTPSYVRECEPMFQKYSSQVFASHFRKTKKKIGIQRK